MITKLHKELGAPMGCEDRVTRRSAVFRRLPLATLITTAYEGCASGSSDSNGEGNGEGNDRGWKIALNNCKEFRILACDGTEEGYGYG